MLNETKIIAIHQPNFIPWLGYFHKIAQSDIFVLLDTVSYSKNSFINRNRIKTPQGEQWLTLPVTKPFYNSSQIKDVQLSQPVFVLPKILRTIQMNYGKTPHFKKYFTQFEAILMQPYSNMATINIDIIKWLVESFSIQTPLIKSSTLAVSTIEPTQRLIEICKKLDGKLYYSGRGGDNYQQHGKFKEENIEVILTDFKHPLYPQLWGDFIPNLSALDYLFNVGPIAKDFFSTSE